MIRLAKFSLAIIFFYSSLISAQKLSSFEVNGNFNFDDSEYLKWSDLRLTQPIYDGIIDSVKSKISKNLLLQGYYFFNFNSSKLIVSDDSASFKIILDIDENTPVVVKNIYFEGIDTTAGISFFDQFEYLKDQRFNEYEIAVSSGACAGFGTKRNQGYH